MVGLPAPLIYFINVDRGKREGEKLAEMIEGIKIRNGAPVGEGYSDEESEAILAGRDRDDDYDEAVRPDRNR